MALTVLVVEREPAARALLERCLAGEGHRVVLAGDGKQALDVLARAGADVVLLDVRLPCTDGLDTLRRVREVFPLLPVVMISEPDAAGASLRIALSQAMAQCEPRARSGERNHACAPFDIPDYRRATLAFEKEYLERKLRENAFNVSRTARGLGLDRTSVHRKMKQLGIDAAGGRR